MLQILFILMHYDADIHANSSFMSYPHLKYGFKKNAKVYFDIKAPTAKMVFGLATQEELEYISNKSDTIEYCEGTHQLSKIQFLVKGNTTFSKKTSKKGFLTPYSFGCNTSYDFNLYLEYKNIHINSDYRIQNVIIYSVIFAIFYLILEICFHFKVKKNENRIVYEIYFILTSVHYFFTFLFLILISFSEFYTGGFLGGFLGGFVLIIIRFDDLLIFVMHFIIVYFLQMFFVVPLIVNAFIILLFLFSIGLCLFYSFFDSFFLTHCLYLFVCIILLCLPSKFSLTRIGIAIFYIGYYYVCVLFNHYLKDPNLSFRTSTIIQMILFSMLVNLVSTIFFLIGFICYNDLDNDFFLNQFLPDPILTTTIPQINYTDLHEE